MNSDHQRRDGERRPSKLINLKNRLVRLIRDYEIEDETIVAAADRSIELITTQLERYRSLQRGDHLSDFQILQDVAKLPRGLIEGRIVLGWRQQELAQQVGLTQPQICTYEKTGYAKIKLITALSIADLMQRELKIGQDT